MSLVKCMNIGGKNSFGFGLFLQLLMNNFCFTDEIDP